MGNLVPQAPSITTNSTQQHSGETKPHNNTKKYGSTGTENTNTACNENQPEVVTVTEDDDGDPENEEEKDVYDPNSVLEDIVEEDKDNCHLRNYQRYIREKERYLVVSCIYMDIVLYYYYDPNY